MRPTVCVKYYQTPAPRRQEVLRYMRTRRESESIRVLLDDCFEEADFREKTAVSYCDMEGDSDTLAFLLSRGGEDLKKHLEGAERVVLFAATVGIGPDRFMNRYAHLSPSTAFCHECIGTAWVEDLCDQFCHDVATKYADAGLTMTSRFSPGYGDCPLELQEDVFRLLGCAKSIGLTLTESLTMLPSKSVTAFVGLKRGESL